MGLTWRASPPSQSTAFGAMSAALGSGANFWNGGELYGTPDRHSGHLLAEYFDAHPEDAKKVVLSIKGGLVKGQLKPDGSEANVRRSVEDTLKALRGTKSIDIFECARVDHNVPIEDTISALAKLKSEGKIGGIGLSEVKASTIERAAKVAEIAAAEVELSLWAADILTNGVAETCARLRIPIVAYSPLCRGILAGDGIRRNADIPDNDFRKGMPKFQDEVLEHNNRLTDDVAKIAERKGTTKAQVAIAWVKELSGREVKDGKGSSFKMGMVVPIPGATTKERVEENTKDVTLNEEEMQELMGLVENFEVKGKRYNEMGMAHAEG